MMRIYSCSLLFVVLLNMMAYGQNNVLYSGKWKADSFFTTFEGSWTIEDQDGQLRLIMADDFEAKKAPDLKIFLSKLLLSDIDGDNAADKNSTALIAELKKYKGSMAFDIPPDVQLADYATILVHCEKYSKFWGGSALKN